MAELDKIGFLYSMTKKSLRKQFNAFYDGLRSVGFIDGKDGKIEYRLADDDYTRLPDLAKQLVQDAKVKVIVAAGGPVAAVKAKAARESVGRDVPIVFTTIADPEGYGLVTDRAHPDKNATGTAGLTTELDKTRLELLKELVPNATTIGLLVNPNRPNEATQTAALSTSATGMGLTPVRAPAGAPSELGAALQKLKDAQVHALLVTADPMFNSRRSDVIKLAKKLSRPAIYQWREFAEDGGLMSYGPSLGEAFRTAGTYAGRIFAGTHTPATLPVVQPDVDLLKPVINFMTAEDLSLDIPFSLLGRSEIINDGPDATHSGLSGALAGILFRVEE